MPERRGGGGGGRALAARRRIAEAARRLFVRADGGERPLRGGKRFAEYGLPSRVGSVRVAACFYTALCGRRDVVDLFREVEEDVQRDRMLALWRRWRWHVIGGAVALVAGTAATVGWQEYRQSAAADRGARFLAAMRLADDEQWETSARAFAQFAEAESGVRAALARLRQAAMLVRAGDRTGALAAWNALIDLRRRPAVRRPRSGARLTAFDRPWRNASGGTTPGAGRRGRRAVAVPGARARRARRPPGRAADRSAPGFRGAARRGGRAAGGCASAPGGWSRRWESKSDPTPRGPCGSRPSGGRARRLRRPVVLRRR